MRHWLALVICVAAASASERVWDGGGVSASWSDAANWVGDVAPGDGDSLIFPSVVDESSTNDLPGRSYAALRVGAGNTIGGIAMTIALIIGDGVGSASLTFPIVLADDAVLDVAAGMSLSMNWGATGGNLRKIGDGEASFSPDFTWQGDLVIEAGLLICRAVGDADGVVRITGGRLGIFGFGLFARVIDVVAPGRLECNGPAGASLHVGGMTGDGIVEVDGAEVELRIERLHPWLPLEFAGSFRGIGSVAIHSPMHLTGDHEIRRIAINSQVRIDGDAIDTEVVLGPIYGGTLSGSCALGDLICDGALAPGGWNEIGTIACRSLDLRPGCIYTADIGSGGCDRIVVSGAIACDGSIRATSPEAPDGSPRVVIEHHGPGAITGSFGPATPPLVLNAGDGDDIAIAPTTGMRLRHTAYAGVEGNVIDVELERVGPAVPGTHAGFIDWHVVDHMSGQNWFAMSDSVVTTGILALDDNLAAGDRTGTVTFVPSPGPIVQVVPYEAVLTIIDREGVGTTGGESATAGGGPSGGTGSSADSRRSSGGSCGAGGGAGALVAVGVALALACSDRRKTKI